MTSSSHHTGKDINCRVILTFDFRDKVEEYNRYLSKYPDHFDLPKVGPG
mgnify:CR=1 FL=1